MAGNLYLNEKVYVYIVYSVYHEKMWTGGCNVEGFTCLSRHEEILSSPAEDIFSSSIMSLISWMSGGLNIEKQVRFPKIKSNILPCQEGILLDNS